MPNRSATLKKPIPGAAAILCSCFMWATLLAECAPLPCGGSPQGANASLSVAWNRATIVPSDGLHDYFKRSDTIITPCEVPPGPSQQALNTTLNQNRINIPAMSTVPYNPLCNLLQVNIAPNASKENNTVEGVKLIESVERPKLNDSFRSLNQVFVSNPANGNPVQLPLRTDWTGVFSNISNGQLKNEAHGLEGSVYTGPVISWKEQIPSIAIEAKPTNTTSALNSYLPVLQPIVQLPPQSVEANLTGQLENGRATGDRINTKREYIRAESLNVPPVNSPGGEVSINSSTIRGAEDRRVSELLRLYVSMYDVKETSADPMYDVLDDNWLAELYPGGTGSAANNLESVAPPEASVSLQESVPLTHANPVRCANLNYTNTPSEPTQLDTSSTNMINIGDVDEMSLHLTFKGVQPRIPPNVYIVLPVREKEVNASIEPCYFKVNFRNKSMSEAYSTNSPLLHAANQSFILDPIKVISSTQQILAAQQPTSNSFLYPRNCTAESRPSRLFFVEPGVTTQHETNCAKLWSPERIPVDSLPNSLQQQKTLGPQERTVKRFARQLLGESLKGTTKLTRMQQRTNPRVARKVHKEGLRSLRHQSNVKK